MISEKKRYKFDTDSLTYIEVKTPFTSKIKKILLTSVGLSVFALIFIFMINAFFSSPEFNNQSMRINKQVGRYQSITKQVDSLSKILEHKHFASDKVYREILEMDSLSENIRFAGTGGYVPNENASYIFNDKIYSNLVLKINNLKSQIKVQDESYNEIYKEALNRNRKLECFPGIAPLNLNNSISITSYFGSRDDPFTFNISHHPGVDLAGQLNTKVYATAKGTVTFAEQSRTGYGNEILIDHGFGYTTRYAHLNKILVERGQKIKRGQLIGLMGSTGRSTGTHLHYEVRFYEKPINPLYFFVDNLPSDEFEKITTNNN